MRERSLAHRIPEFSRARVLCLGDVMLDRFVYGEADRLSPEAPIPVLRVQREDSMPGGAGNVVRNVATLGASATLVAVVGEDDAGSLLRRRVEEQENVVAHLVGCADRATTVKTRFVVAGQQMLRADVETPKPVDAETTSKLLALFESELPQAHVVVLSDYGKGLLSDAVLRAAIELARAHGKPILADPKSRDFARYRGVTVLVPNAAELAAATGLPTTSDEEAAAAADAARASAGIQSILVTRSARGMTLTRDHRPPLHIAARAREVHDVSGAGDTAAATMAVAIAAGLGLEAAARLANVAAGIVVGKVGTAAVRSDDLIDEVQRADVMSTSAEVVSLARAEKLVQRWREEGLRIGFTNGCFDLIHPGHVSLLSQARAACDRLIVGLNTDDSIRRLKGPERPVQSETARSIVLASLAAVDLVVPFDDDTPIRLVHALRPDLLVKGANYTMDQVVGADFVKSYGGEVLLAEMEAGYSTTRTIAKIGGSR